MMKVLKYNRWKLVAMLLATLLLVVLVIITIVDIQVKQSAKGFLYNNIETIPHNRVGLLLGTSKYLTTGKYNQYYQNRIEAAVNLFVSGKIDFILISGDNRYRSYNEPITMKNDLVGKGIPDKKIFLDYAGFRTLDSVVRSKLIFGQDSITVISQRFHNERAIYLARRNGISAIGYNAADVNAFHGFKIQIRELLARVKMVIDLMTGKKPRFGGDRIEIH